MMDIQRINTYDDNRFSHTALQQHGCFFVDGAPYEVEIISDYEAVVCGENQAVYTELINEFRFYAPHITRFYEKGGRMIKEYPRVQRLTLHLDQVQPSQFWWTSIRLQLSAHSFRNHRILSSRCFPTKTVLFPWMGTPGYTMPL